MKLHYTIVAIFAFSMVAGAQQAPKPKVKPVVIVRYQGEYASSVTPAKAVPVNLGVTLVKHDTKPVVVATKLGR